MVHKAMLEAGKSPPTILIKLCPESNKMSADLVRKGVETALDCLQLNTIDVMQFHWWRY